MEQSMRVLIELPWPTKNCLPNTGAHPVARTRARKALRQRAGAMAVLQSELPSGLVRCTLVFNPPDKRGRDLDNLVAGMKGALDGLFDANDRDDGDIRYLAGCWGRGTAKGGRVTAVVMPWCRDRDLAWLLGESTALRIQGAQG
tara:strand:+ start:654 stop:1085 length:432 start_codon:yes stop_codon:yes gene_type:complete